TVRSVTPSSLMNVKCMAPPPLSQTLLHPWGPPAGLGSPCPSAWMSESLAFPGQAWGCLTGTRGCLWGCTSDPTRES
ncbi:hypothetical protein AAFF_G00125680, partial [Aldrovandia affinis]